MTNNNSTKATKMTKAEIYAGILSILAECENVPEAYIARLEKDIELATKASMGTSASDKKKAEKTNDICNHIMELMSGIGKPCTISEINKFDPNLKDWNAKETTQMTAAYMRKLVEAGKVTKTTEKKVTYFSLA